MNTNDLIALLKNKISTASAAITDISNTDSDYYAAQSVHELTESLKILYDLKEKEEENDYEE